MQLNNNRVRTFLLIILLISMVSTAIELLLLEHTESRTQWIPLVLLLLGLLATIASAVWPGSISFNLMRVVMSAFMVAGLLGLYLHYRGNVEFELEMNPALHGWELFKKTMMGATPTLSPGVLSQLGLLGFIYAYLQPRRRLNTSGETQ